MAAPPFLELDLQSDGASSNSVRYFLTKMDFRKELRRNFWGQELMYADVDSGEAWGRGKELELSISDYEKPLSGVGVVDAIEAMLVKAVG